MNNSELIKTIDALMAENEIIKSNALSARIATQSPTATRMYNNAKAENNAYLKVLNLINEEVLTTIKD